ncbi:MAG: cupin domain-containing protein [Cyanobacteria bacterium J06635_15]
MQQKFYIRLFVSFIAVILLPLIAYSTWAEVLPSDGLRAQAQVQSVLPDQRQWRENPTVAGVQSAIALGDPSHSELYVLFGKMAVGVTFPAHTHPDDRITTVLSGVMYYGIGEQFDQANIQPYPAGSVVYTPADTPHFMWSKEGETLMQEVGIGPTDLRFVASME